MSIKGKRSTASPIESSDKLVQGAYDAALILTAFALPFSNFLMSQGVFLLVIAWAIDRWKNGPLFRNRGWTHWKSQPTLWAILALFAWQLIAQTWTSEWATGWTALRIKLPLLAFPLILTTGRWNQKQGLFMVQNALGFSVGVACLSCLWIGYSNDTSLYPRDWSPFISHIRFSLMIAFVWAWWFWRWIRHSETRSGWVLLLLTLLGGWVIWKTASLTGALMIPLSGIAVLWMEGLGREKPSLMWVRKCLKGVGLLALAVVALGAWSLQPAYPTSQAMLSKTVGGETYQHFPERCLKENGGHVWINLAWGELQEAWSVRSTSPLDGPDQRGQELKTTLIRFLTSKGYTKDANGIEQLTPLEIQVIEQGIPTVLELEHHGLMRRWDIIQFEVANHIDGGDPSGHSLVQRIAFLQAAFHIYRENPLFGVGTGDLKVAFAQAYEAVDSPLRDPFRLRAHNQYVTFMLSGGPLAFILWLSVLGTLMIVPSYHKPRQPALLFLLILGLSCFTEDTLETQAGITFAGLFIGLFGRRFPPKN